jgi:hypothetical protein
LTSYYHMRLFFANFLARAVFVFLRPVFLRIENRNSHRPDGHRRPDGLHVFIDNPCADIVILFCRAFGNRKPARAESMRSRRKH